MATPPQFPCCVCVWGGRQHLWEAHLSSDLWEGVSEQWEERKEGKWGGVCVWRRWRDGGDFEEYYHRTTHNDRPVELRLTHLWSYKKCVDLALSQMSTTVSCVANQASRCPSFTGDICLV